MRNLHDGELRRRELTQIMPLNIDRPQIQVKSPHPLQFSHVETSIHKFILKLRMMTSSHCYNND